MFDCAALANVTVPAFPAKTMTMCCDVSKKNMARYAIWTIWFAAIFACLRPVSASLSLSAVADERRVVNMGSFGYETGGKIKLLVTHMFVPNPSFIDSNHRITSSIGFTLDYVFNDISARNTADAANQEATDRHLCWLQASDYAPTINSGQLTNGTATATANVPQGTIIPTDPQGRPLRFVFSLRGRSPDEMAFEVTIQRPGMYALFFYNCAGMNSNQSTIAPKKSRTAGSLPPEPASFHAFAEEYNVRLSTGEKQYLGVGERPLPLIFALWTAVFASMTGILAWKVIQSLRAGSARVPGITAVNRLHYGLVILFTLKTLSLLFEAVKYRHYGATGSGNAWDALYYVFQGLKTLMLFTVVILIGSGWSALKVSLGDQDRCLLWLVLGTQLVVNILIAVVEESAEGGAYWGTWVDILRIIDIVCCCVVLLPMVWSLKNLNSVIESSHGRETNDRRNLPPLAPRGPPKDIEMTALREEEAEDGFDGEKVALATHRMRQFQILYLVVLVYIYFSRIAIVMIEAMLPYNAIWWGPMTREFAAAAFYAFLEWKFMPGGTSMWDVDASAIPRQVRDNRRSRPHASDQPPTVSIPAPEKDEAAATMDALQDWRGRVEMGNR